MAIAQPISPAFGTANLSNCEREQIHLAGSIQPHGALLVVREFDQVIVQASDVAAAISNSTMILQGARVRSLGGNLWERMHGRLPESLREIPIALRCTRRPARSPVELRSFIAPPAGELVIEIEDAGPADGFFRLHRDRRPDGRFRNHARGPVRRRRPHLQAS